MQQPKGKRPTFKKFYAETDLDKLGDSPYKVFNNRGNDGKDMPKRKKVTEDDDGYKERGQRREGLSMLSNVERFLASEGDAQSVAVVHKAIETMYMHVADVVEGGDDRDEDRYDGIDPEPEYRRETDQDRYGYPGDR